MSMTLRIEPRISCIYHYATRVNSLVIRMVSTRYLDTGHDTCCARYLLAGLGCPARVPPRPRLRPWRHWSGHQLGFHWSPFWLQNRASKLPCGDGPPPDWALKQAAAGQLVGFIAPTCSTGQVVNIQHGPVSRRTEIESRLPPHWNYTLVRSTRAKVCAQAR